MVTVVYFRFFFFKQKTAYEMRISDWSSDVCSSDLSDELSTAVSKLRTRADAVFGDDIEAGIEWLKSEYDLDGVGAAQLANYYGKIGSASCRERVCQYV